MMDPKAHNKLQLFLTGLFLSIVLAAYAPPLLAQDENDENPDVLAIQGEEQISQDVVEELQDEFEEESTEMEDLPVVRLQSLDKVTARTMTFEAKVGGTVKFGEIYIKVQACRKAPPLEAPESAAFMQIWQVTPEEEAEWIFSGWMFASSPALSHMDHPIYDVWVLDCLSEKGDQPEEDRGQALEGEGEVEEDQIPAKPDEAAPNVEDIDMGD